MPETSLFGRSGALPDAVLRRPYSVTPTFDSRVVGEPYTLEIREGDRAIRRSTMPDPFHNTTIHPRGWRVALAVLLRRYKVSVHVGAPSQLVEDVMELDDNYRGMSGSKRRAEAELDGALRDFAARAGSTPMTKSGLSQSEANDAATTQPTRSLPKCPERRPDDYA